MAFDEEDVDRLSLDRVRKILTHPLMKKLDDAQLDGEQLRRFCDIRYNAASEFELLLERALELAQADPSKQELAKALHENLCDERGLDYVTGMPHGRGAHSAWRKDFLDAINVQTIPERANHHELYHYEPGDDLPTLVGILLAAEKTIPSEDARILNSMRRVFPDKFTMRKTPDEGTPEQLKNTLYLQDHVRHDTIKHLPDLERAVVSDIGTPAERMSLVKGMDRFVEERFKLYDHIAQQVGVSFPIEPLQQVPGR